MLDHWSNRDPADPAGRIDRTLADRSYRLSAGIAVGPRFESVSGALLVSSGLGKHLRVKYDVRAVRPIPDELRGGWQEFAGSRQHDFAQLSLLTADLAEIQALVIEDLKRHAGRYVDRVLTVGVTDPGVWSTDFDGQLIYGAICDPTRLAELTGITVIDSFPSRDLVAGGRGTPLEALPLWLLLADRNAKIAHRHTGALLVGAETQFFWLPPSDGLDSDIPEIQFASAPGMNFVRSLVQQAYSLDLDSLDVASLNASGRKKDELLKVWRSVIDRSATDVHNRNEIATLSERLVSHALDVCDGNDGSPADLIRSSIVFVVEMARDRLEAVAKRDLSFDRIVVAGHDTFGSSIVNQLQQMFPQADVQLECGHLKCGECETGSGSLSAVVAAVLGIMNVDQQPANLPWITGCKSQRILGRITQGCASNWRQLLMHMADFRPPVMKLRDAV